MISARRPPLSLLLLALGVFLTAAAFMGRSGTYLRAASGDNPARQRAKRSGEPFDKAAAFLQKYQRGVGILRQTQNKVADSPFPVKLSPTLDLDKNQTVQAETLAAQISMFSVVPPARPQFFSGYEAAMNSQIIGWGGNIMDVDAGPDGFLVMVRVGPRFNENFAYTVDTKKYFEYFRVSPDGLVTYLESTVPDGGAGDPPAGFMILP